MKPKWIIAGILISIIVHISIMMALGKIQLNLSFTDFIDTYIFESKKESEKHKIIPNTEQLKNLDKKENNNEKVSENVKPENFTKNTEESSQTEFSQENEKIQSEIKNNPFNRFINESMKFDIYWMGIYVGSAIVSVKGDSSEVTITSMVKSASFISNFYYVNDHAESKIEYGKPKHFKLVQVEGKYRGNKETIFDYNQKEIIFINHLKNNTTYHKGIDKVFMDVLSGFFYLRTLPISLKEPVSVDIFDSNKFTTVQVQPIKEEKIELSNKKEIDAIVIKPLLDTEGLFKRKGDIIIWLSKDDSKIPLKIETKVPVGRVTAELKEYKKE
ncbi:MULTISPECIES: DUF3108 domain-containing protein [Thermodesulfovibrio]|jgi:hypothetical protein|uniref:DUF3108 domain-containing protein n=1 Tax=Thermodesulfovibrio yellowstonii (strain ATCC 51303 / DSM 11347 / YP87) TaxID=289376 RepID=B5YKV2_THEYD|nr:MULTISPECIES: DUF3108 domain-containing protein [Thermodesulfovibrio]ACI21734.1 conserved hypothetical protein [Thermodesulfovibrio yellowstonii DSM 11347]